LATINIDLSSRGSEPDVALFKRGAETIHMSVPIRCASEYRGRQPVANSRELSSSLRVFHPAWSYRT